jgi:hypothetical protein
MPNFVGAHFVTRQYRENSSPVPGAMEKFLPLRHTKKFEKHWVKIPDELFCTAHLFLLHHRLQRCGLMNIAVNRSFMICVTSDCLTYYILPKLSKQLLVY